MNSLFNTNANAERLRNLPINDDIVNRYCCDFDGTPQYYEGANADSFKFRSDRDWSVSFWWNRMGNSGAGTFLDNRDAGGNDGVRIDTSVNKIRIRIENNAGSVVFQGTSGTGYEVGQDGYWWSHIVICWNGTLAIPVCSFYINGILTPTIITTQNPAITFTGNLSNVKYAQNYNNTLNCEGCLKDFSIWKKVLDLDEVRYIFNRGVPNNLNETDFSAFLTHWYRFGDGYTSTLSDDNTQIIDFSTQGIANLLGFGVPVANCPLVADPEFL